MGCTISRFLFILISAKKICKINNHCRLFSLTDLPECRTGAATYFIYSDPINVTCSFASHPPVSRITWHWNTSNDVNSSKPAERLQKIQTNPSLDNGDFASAHLTVFPDMISDDKELTCRGINELGNQTKSCKFFIKRASKNLQFNNLPKFHGLRGS